jgi:hypothetical protein
MLHVATPTLHRRSRHQERETLDFVEIEECSEWEQMSEEQDLEKQQKTNQRRKNLTQDQSRKQQIFLVSRRPNQEENNRRQNTKIQKERQKLRRQNMTLLRSHFKFQDQSKLVFEICFFLSKNDISYL